MIAELEVRCDMKEVHKTDMTEDSVRIIYVCYYLLCFVNVRVTQQYVNLIQPNSMVFRQGVLAWYPSREGLASFPGRFGREKWPGNFRGEFKLLLPLPESWKTQSEFRSLSHDNSKPNCVMR